MDEFVVAPLTAYGADPGSASPAPDAVPAPMAPAPLPFVGGVAPPAAASPDRYRAARVGAGLGLLMATAGTGIGLWVGGPMGAGSGLLLVGSVRNTLRAMRGWSDPDPVVRQDAGTSASLALFGALLGGYLGYRVYSKRTGDE